MNPESIFQTLDRIGPAARVALTGLAHRGELAALEAGEARRHFTGSLALWFGSAALAAVGAFAVNLALAAAVWHREDRALLIALLAAAELLLSVAIAAWAARRMKHWQPLPETRRQLRADRDCLQQILPRPSNHSDAHHSDARPQAGAASPHSP